MIQAFFRKLSIREKGMFLAVLWLGLLFWASITLGDLRKLYGDWQTSHAIMEAQAQTLALAEGIENQLKTIHSKLDPEKTFDAAELAAQIDTIARAQDLNYSMKTPHTEDSDPITLHEISISIRQASLDKLLSFDQAVRKHAPYIALQKVSMEATRDPAFLNASFVINAFELTDKPSP